MKYDCDKFERLVKKPKRYFSIPLSGEYVTTARELRTILKRLFNEGNARVKVIEHNDKYGNSQEFWNVDDLNFLKKGELRNW